MNLIRQFNKCFDIFALPQFRWRSHHFPMFQLCGCTGLAVAALMASWHITRLGLSHAVLLSIAMAAVVTFAGLVMATKIMTGEEHIIYYHHEIAIMTVVGLMLWLLNQPILPYLDITILGIGTFLAFGRVGCFMVGCCHGHPHPFGVCYGSEHKTAGFTPYYVGVRLFPVQLIESIWVAIIVVIGTVILFHGYSPGTTLAWYITSYGLMRFCLEFLRGDPDRPYYLGFSEAQWISIVLMGAVVVGEWRHPGPFFVWQIMATAVVAATMPGLGFARDPRRLARHRILNPSHIREIMQAVEAVSATANESSPVSRWDPGPALIPKTRTSLGIQITAGRIQDSSGFFRHYSFFCSEEKLTTEIAGILANLVLGLKHPDAAFELLEGKNGVFHLIVNPPSTGAKQQEFSTANLKETRQHAF